MSEITKSHSSEAAEALDEILIALRGTTRFDLEDELRLDIGERFKDDAYELLHRVGLVWPDDAMFRQRFRSKVFVDIVMAIECTLKAAIIFSANVPVEDAYMLARGKGHGLLSLFEEAQDHSLAFNSITDDERDMLQQAQKLGVSMRYSLDLFTLLFDESFREWMMDDGDISGTISSERLASAILGTRAKAITEHLRNSTKRYAVVHW